MIYNYEVSEVEQKEIYDAYERILTITCNFIKSLDNQNIFENFFSCVFLLFHGFLSSTHIFTKDNDYDYVFFQNISFSLYPLNGIGCCRHASELLQSLFKKLGYFGKLVYCELLEVPVNSPFQRNHAVLECTVNDQTYFFDLIKWNIGIKKENKIISWKNDCWYRFEEKDVTLYNRKMKEITYMYHTIYQKLETKSRELAKFYDLIMPDLQAISSILEKYETYRSLRIQYVYE